MKPAKDLTAEEVERWRQVQPGRFRPWTSAPAAVWLVLVVLAFAFADAGGCTPSEPCGPTWWEGFETTVGMAAPLVLLIHPSAAALWFSGFAAAVFVTTEWPVGDQPRPFVAGFAVALGVATYQAASLRRRRRARVAALLTDVPRDVFPRPGQVRAGLPLGARAGMGVVVAGAVFVGWGVQHGRVMAEREAAAEALAGTVVSHGDDGYLLTVEAEGDRYEVDSLDAEDYPVGSRQDIRVDGDRVTLAVERYDPSWTLAVGLGGALLGLSWAGRAWRRRQELRSLLTDPSPVHRVRLGAMGDAQVLPVDGPIDVLPLVALPVVLVEEADMATEADEAEPVEEALLYGAPVVGGFCGAVLATGEALVPGGRVHKASDVWPMVAGLEGEGGVGGHVEIPDDVDALRARLTRPSPARAPLGGLLVVGAVAAGFLIGRDSEDLLTAVWRCAIAAVFAFDGLVHLASAVRLTPEALVHDGPTTRRTVPWERVKDIAVVNGVVLVALPEDQVLPLPWLPHRPWRWWGGARDAWARAWAAVLTAEARRERPRSAAKVTTEPRLYGAAVAVAFVVAVLLGLRVRP